MNPPLRRSFVEDRLRAAAPGDPATERAALDRLALVDLSLEPRAGFKGPGAPEWLAAQGLDLPEPNRARRQADGTLAVRLAPREALLLGGPVDRLEPAWRDERACRPGEPIGYPVPRADSHFWFLVAGEHGPAMLAKLCGVDLRPHRFPPLAVAQTQAMRLSVIVVRDDGDRPVWHLLGDSASAGYAWDCLVDAMAEFGGRPAARDALGNAPPSA